MALPAGRYTIFDIRFPAAAAPGMPLYATRGMHGVLRPIDMAQGDSVLRRTVNGGLIDVSAPQMRKYRLEASGDDQEPPALDGLWAGMEVEVDCHVELSYPTAGGSPSRPAVPGSERVSGDYTLYCPVLLCRVLELSVERSEWEAAYSWQIALSEI